MEDSSWREKHRPKYAGFRQVRRLLQCDLTNGLTGVLNCYMGEPKTTFFAQQSGQKLCLQKK